MGYPKYTRPPLCLGKKLTAAPKFRYMCAYGKRSDACAYWCLAGSRWRWRCRRWRTLLRGLIYFHHRPFQTGALGPVRLPLSRGPSTVMLSKHTGARVARLVPVVIAETVTVLADAHARRLFHHPKRCRMVRTKHGHHQVGPYSPIRSVAVYFPPNGMGRGSLSHMCFGPVLRASCMDGTFVRSTASYAYFSYVIFGRKSTV